MLDAYIIDFLKEEERRRQEDARVPLYIHPPGFDGYRDNPRKPPDTNEKGYIEIDIVGEHEDDPNIIRV
jgi:hypothetical protein